MIIHLLMRRFVLLNEFDSGGSTGGGDVSPSPAVESTPAPAVESTAAAPAAPTSMLEAIDQAMPHLSGDAPGEGGQPRDEFGRFAPKAAGGAPAADVADPAKAAQQAPADKPPAEEGADDLLKEPEGLAPKSSERFHRLANEVRDLRGQVEQRDQAISYVKETFQNTGITAEQVDQAASVIGALNRGDLETAERVLMEQLQQIAIARGRPIGQIDPLAQFPDLRAAVDGLQVSEEHALQLARARVIEQGQQQRTQQQARQEQEQRAKQQQQEQAQQQVNTALADIDTFTREMSAKDMDWPVIEAKLLPRVQTLLNGVPPAQWLNIVKTQYELIKDVSAGAVRQPTQQAGQVLRPTGQGSPAAAPKTMFDAMFPQG